MLLLLDWWRKKPIDAPLGYGRVVRDGAVGLTCAVAIAMIGGLYIAAMLGNIRFFMEFDFYRGVKLTFVLPILLVAAGYLLRFPLWGRTIASPQDFAAFARDFLNIPIKMGTLILLGMLAMVASFSSDGAAIRQAFPCLILKWLCAGFWRTPCMLVRGKRNFSSAIRRSSSWSPPCTANGRRYCISCWCWLRR